MIKLQWGEGDPYPGPWIICIDHLRQKRSASKLKRRYWGTNEHDCSQSEKYCGQKENTAVQIKSIAGHMEDVAVYVDYIVAKNIILRPH